MMTTDWGQKWLAVASSCNVLFRRRHGNQSVRLVVCRRRTENYLMEKRNTCGIEMKLSR